MLVEARDVESKSPSCMLENPEGQTGDTGTLVLFIPFLHYSQGNFGTQVSRLSFSQIEKVELLENVIPS